MASALQPLWGLGPEVGGAQAEASWSGAWEGRRDLDPQTALGVRPGRNGDFCRLPCPPMTTILDISVGTPLFHVGSCPVLRHTRGCV